MENILDEEKLVFGNLPYFITICKICQKVMKNNSEEEKLVFSNSLSTNEDTRGERANRLVKCILLLNKNIFNALRHSYE